MKTAINPKGVGVAMLGLLGATALTFQASSAAFSGTTDNSANSLGAATVSLSDNDSGSALFDVTNMVPGESTTNCITVTYGGDTDSVGAVKLYASVTDDSSFAGEVDIQVEEGSGGTFDDCTGFSADSTLYSTNTLSAFDTAHSDYSDGLSGFTPSQAAPSKSYRITMTLGSDTANSFQGDSLTAALTWEVQSS